jgi:hypothetical protein
MSAYLHLKDFRRGRENAENNLSTFQEGSPLWFSFLEYYFLLALHTENYVQAIALLNKATQHARFKKLDSEERDRWMLSELFLMFVCSALSDQNAILDQFSKRSSRSNKLLQTDLTQLPRDLKIFGLHTLIARIILLIERGKTNDATNLISELKIQATRQFKKREQFRALFFIRLLEALSKKNYNTNEFKTVHKYQQCLEETPFRYRGQWSEMEIVPYEKLWQLVLSISAV